MQDIQILGAGTASFPSSPTGAIHTGDREEFFSAPPPPLEQQNTSKKSFFSKDTLFLFLSAIGIIGITVLFNFFSPFAKDDFGQRFFSEWSKNSRMTEVLSIEQKQSALWEKYGSLQDETSLEITLQELKKNEIEWSQKIQELSDKFPYKKFSSSEQVKIRAFFQVFLDFSKKSRFLYIEGLETCVFKSFQKDIDTKSFCLEINETFQKNSDELPSNLSKALGLNVEQQSAFKESFSKALSKSEQ